MLPPVRCRHGARLLVAALAGFALLFAPGTDQEQPGRAGPQEPIQARILAPTVSEAFVGVAPKPSAPDLRSVTQHRSRPIALPLGVISALGAISFMWGASAARDRSRIGPRFIALPACVPRGPPALEPI
jgi:hypothetical protein